MFEFLVVFLLLMIWLKPQKGNETVTVFIKFIDGEEIVIEGANEYSSSHDSNNWKVKVDKTNLFFNKDQVKYIGKMEYLRSERT